MYRSLNSPRWDQYWSTSLRLPNINGLDIVNVIPDSSRNCSSRALFVDVGGKAIALKAGNVMDPLCEGCLYIQLAPAKLGES